MASGTAKRVAEMKQKAIAVHAEVIRKRNQKIAEVADSLNATMREIHSKHESMRTQIRRETINREVHLRVSRGLQSLEEFVGVLRQSTVTDKRLTEAIRDPVVSGSYLERERRASMSEMLKSLQKQLVQQHEFLNVAAHELRTPILPILANTELLRDKIKTGSRELDTIFRNAVRLQQLSENILSATKIDSNSLTIDREEFDLNTLIRQMIEDEQHAIEKRNLRIVFVPQTSNLPVLADESRIGQVVVNLVDNAIKFTQEGQILVTSETVGKEIIVRVHDDGPGIDPQVFPVLFSKFASRSPSGTGLGLFICRKIIEAHGGTIHARNNSAPGRSGAIFTFTLPALG
jgi:signal transduction histidine kinase